MVDFRFEVHDECGCLRKFYKRSDACYFMRDRLELRLVVAPKRNIFQEMWHKLGECLL